MKESLEVSPYRDRAIPSGQRQCFVGFGIIGDAMQA